MERKMPYSVTFLGTLFRKKILNTESWRKNKPMLTAFLSHPFDFLRHISIQNLKLTCDILDSTVSRRCGLLWSQVETKIKLLISMLIYR